MGSTKQIGRRLCSLALCLSIWLPLAGGVSPYTMTGALALEESGERGYGMNGDSGEKPPVKEEYKAGEVLVRFKQSVRVSTYQATTTSSSVNGILRRYRVQAVEGLFRNARKPVGAAAYRDADGKVKAVPDLTTVYRLRLSGTPDPSDVIKELSVDPEVEYAEFNYVRRVADPPRSLFQPFARGADTVDAITSPSDPYYSSSGSWGQPYDDMWGLRRIGASSAWDLATGAATVVIAVVDTGVDATHPDLAGKLVPGWDFVNEDPDPRDDNGHGTHVAGTIGAATNNGVGIAGLCWNCKIMPLKALAGYGGGALSDLVGAIQYAADNGALVLNASWGGYQYSRLEADTISYAQSRGLVIVAAAGNESTSMPFYPAAFPGVIAVAATDPFDRPAPFSNQGSYITVAAPGEAILSLRAAGTAPSYYRYVVGSNYGVLNGTSMASPHVAGLAGLLLSRNPEWSPTQVRCAISSSAEDLGSPGWDEYYGSGLINAYGAVRLDACADASPPGARVLAPSGGETWLVGSSQRITWVAGDGLGVDRVDVALSVDKGASWTNLRTGLANSGLYAFTVPNTPTAQAMVRVTAYDAQGNASSDTGDAAFRIVVPDLSSSRKTVNTQRVNPGDVLTYTVNLTETSGASGFSLSVADPIPAETTYLTDSVTGGATYNAALNRIEWSRAPGSYTWSDSDQPGGPAFNWVDITASGTAVQDLSDDFSHGPFPIGFAFPLYGTYFAQFYVCDNGFISFSQLSPLSCPYSNAAVPSASAPLNLVAPFWDDLYPLGGGSIYYWSNAVDTLVVSWIGVPHYWTGGPYTFQAILKKDGSITYQYSSMASPTDSATIGIQNTNGGQGLQVAYNQTYIHDSLATKIVAPAGNATFSFAVNSRTDLTAGTVITNTAVISDGFTIYNRSVTTTVTIRAPSPPTAVTLSSFGAHSGAGDWPLAAAALVGLVSSLGGSLLWRRKSRQRHGETRVGRGVWGVSPHFPVTPSNLEPEDRSNRIGPFGLRLPLRRRGNVPDPDQRRIVP